ncbi:MAG: hypothetical protein JKX99_01595 [Robiginitomaculum sp.]|nr:hypothetical protein [Robiginitomaculum sp.]
MSTLVRSILLISTSVLSAACTQPQTSSVITPAPDVTAHAVVHLAQQVEAPAANQQHIQLSTELAERTRAEAQARKFADTRVKHDRLKREAEASVQNALQAAEDQITAQAAAKTLANKTKSTAEKPAEITQQIEPNTPAMF